MNDLTLELAAPSQLDELFELEMEVKRDLLWEDMLVVDDKNFYANLLANGGRILMARDGSRAVGAGIISFPKLGDPESLCEDLGYPASLAARTVRIESVYVLPAYRGHGLAGRLLRELLDYAETKGKDLSLSTVWPGNASNLSAIFKQGRTLRKLAFKYGGLPRFIIVGTPTPPRLFGEIVWIPSMDFAGHAAQFAAGRFGVALRRGADKHLQSLDFAVGYQYGKDTF